MNELKAANPNAVGSEEARVRSWLAEQGFPLEMRVAKLLKMEGFEIVQGDYYLDEQTGKSRELDIVASRFFRRDVFELAIHFLIECKVAPQPWVLFYSEDPSSNTKLPFRGLGNSNAENLISNFDEIPFLKTGSYFAPQHSAYAVKRASKKQREEVDQSYASCVGMANALDAIDFDVKGLRGLLALGGDKISFVFPTFVLEGSLFQISLGASDSIEIRQSTTGRLQWKQRGPSRELYFDLCVEEALAQRIAGICVDAEKILDAVCKDRQLIDQKNLALARLLNAQMASSS